MITRKFKDQKAGSMTLEAALVLPIFIFLFLSIFGLFGMVSARHQITRATIQAARCMSLDPYLEKRVAKDKTFSTLEQFLTTLARKQIAGDNIKLSEDLEGNAKAKDRFVRYFADGDAHRADEMLKAMGVVGGLNGIKFEYSGEEGDTSKLTVTYRLKFLFDFVHAGEIGELTHSVESRLWKQKIDLYEKK